MGRRIGVNYRGGNKSFTNKIKNFSELKAI